jgi:hypothetical protein
LPQHQRRLDPSMPKTPAALVYRPVVYGPKHISAVSAGRRSKFALVAKRTSITTARIAIPVHNDISP